MNLVIGWDSSEKPKNEKAGSRRHLQADLKISKDVGGVSRSQSL